MATTELEAKLLAMIKGGTTHERTVARSKLLTLRRRRGAALRAGVEGHIPEPGELTPAAIFDADDSAHGPTEEEETTRLNKEYNRKRW